MSEQRKFIVQEDVIQNIFRYLVLKPYSEVEPLIKSLQELQLVTEKKDEKKPDKKVK